MGEKIVNTHTYIYNKIDSLVLLFGLFYFYSGLEDLNFLIILKWWKAGIDGLISSFKVEENKHLLSVFL